MSPTQPPIAILGAGPSGLTLARLLEVANIAYIVFERDESAAWAYNQSGSGTLDIHTGTGQLALQRAGLFDRFKAMARYDASTTLADWNGEVHARMEQDTERPEIDRRDLRALLLGSVPEEKICWGRKVAKVERGSGGLMSIAFVDGSIESGFRLVVGADGAWSKTRELITSNKPQYSGLHYLTTNISPTSTAYATAVRLAGNGNYMACGDGKQVVVQKLGNGSYYCPIGLKLPEHWSSENSTLVKDSNALREHIAKDYFAGWPEMHLDLIRHSNGDFRPWPLYNLPADTFPWQHVESVTLIGDAAHLTTPSGEGVNAGMFDSVQLAEQIVKYGLEHLDDAAEEYEEAMFLRAEGGLKKALMMNELLYAPDAPKSFLRVMSQAEH